ncbi:hypothetical protein F5Y03DRAFT_373880 [Xylaria venustula]|nr:hypothetical protein F5Y03DRAFT_373880 [Xylaria venustula]
MKTNQFLTAAFAASMIQSTSAGHGPVNLHVVPPPGPVQHGALVDRCGGWALAAPGMTCFGLTQSHGLDLPTFKLLNPQIKSDCVHDFWSGYYYCVALAEDASDFPTFKTMPSGPKKTPPPKPPHHSNCQAGIHDDCQSAVFAASETPAPMVDWCKRYLDGPKCTETRPDGIFRSYDKFPKQAMASSQCAYIGAPPMAPRFSTACECFTQMHPRPT